MKAFEVEQIDHVHVQGVSGSIGQHQGPLRIDKHGNVGLTKP